MSIQVTRIVKRPPELWVRSLRSRQWHRVVYDYGGGEMYGTACGRPLLPYMKQVARSVQGACVQCLASEKEGLRE